MLPKQWLHQHRSHDFNLSKREFKDFTSNTSKLRNCLASYMNFAACTVLNDFVPVPELKGLIDNNQAILFHRNSWHLLELYE